MKAYGFYATWKDDEYYETEHCQFFGETARQDAQTAWDELATLAVIESLTSIEELEGVEFLDGFPGRNDR